MHRRNMLQALGFAPLLAKNLLGQPQTITQRNSAPPDASPDFFYRPQNAWAADFIPLYANGEYQLFFLLDWRDTDHHGEGTPWYRVSTTDFVHFKDHGEMLSRGTKADQDLYVFTGSAIKADDGFHIFYTGHNPYMPAQGKPQQGVMHAVSKDMNTWTKLPGQTFFAPGDRYEKDDWRDPFVFWNSETKEYNMLVAARHREGIPRRRGVTALCTSKDLNTWQVQAPFYSPALFYTHECPDLFKMGDWWYLLFSEFTDKVRTRYRMGRTLHGPWITPAQDDFDGHAFYAAKSASDGKRRFLFGWNPTRTDSLDTGDWNWGGNLVVHELWQEKNGELAVKMPESVSSSFTKQTTADFQTGSGKFKYSNGILTLDARETFSAAVGGTQSQLCRIAATARFERGAREFGLMFRTGADLESSYYIRVDVLGQRLLFDKWPRARAEVSAMSELERPLKIKAGEAVTLNVIIDGNKGVAYLNDTIAMNFRAYELPSGSWGFFACDGLVTFENIRVSVQ